METKKRFIAITVAPIIGSANTRVHDGLLAGFPKDKDSGKDFISLFKESSYYLLSTSAYLITKIHWHINGDGGVVFYRRGTTIEESKETMKEALTLAIGLFKTFLAASGGEVRNGSLADQSTHLGYTPLKEVVRGASETKRHTVLTPESEKGGDTTTTMTGTTNTSQNRVVTPREDWSKPIWMTRKSNQHTVKGAAQVREELLERIASASAEAAEGTVNRPVASVTYKPGKRVIPTHSMCFTCKAKWQCTLPIEYNSCGIYEDNEQVGSLSSYPDGCG